MMFNPPRDDEEKDLPLRDPADYVEAIGPEKLSPEETVDHLHEDGFEKMDEDDFVSDPTGPADMPNWTQDDYDKENIRKDSSE